MFAKYKEPNHCLLSGKEKRKKLQRSPTEKEDSEDRQSLDVHLGIPEEGPMESSNQRPNDHGRRSERHSEASLQLTVEHSQDRESQVLIGGEPDNQSNEQFAKCSTEDVIKHMRVSLMMQDKLEKLRQLREGKKVAPGIEPERKPYVDKAGSGITLIKEMKVQEPLGVTQMKDSEDENRTVKDGAGKESERKEEGKEGNEGPAKKCACHHVDWKLDGGEAIARTCIKNGKLKGILKKPKFCCNGQLIKEVSVIYEVAGVQ